MYTLQHQGASVFVHPGSFIPMCHIVTFRLSATSGEFFICRSIYKTGSTDRLLSYFLHGLLDNLFLAYETSFIKGSIGAVQQLLGFFL
jgi:hypothetical protein